MFDERSVYKLLYALQIVDDIMQRRERQSLFFVSGQPSISYAVSHAFAALPRERDLIKWTDRFASKGGVHHLMKLVRQTLVLTLC